MKRNYAATILAAIGGIICVGNFIYKYVRFSKADYTILLAGIFIIALGAWSYFKNTT